MAEPHNNMSEQRDIAGSLAVEQLDTNLFRSTSLYTPYRARGVFGGQVISQAVVAATKCVSSEYALHVRTTDDIASRRDDLRVKTAKVR